MKKSTIFESFDPSSKSKKRNVQSMIQTTTVADLLNDQTHPDISSNEEIEFKQVDLKLNKRKQVLIATSESEDQSDSEIPAPVIEKSAQRRKSVTLEAIRRKHIQELQSEITKNTNKKLNKKIKNSLI